MRNLILAFVITFGIAGSADCFEIEKEQVFGGPDGREVTMLATMDVSAIADVLEVYVAENPEIRLRYIQASSNEIYLATRDEKQQFDLIMSAGMHMQMKLANDGYAASVQPKAQKLPEWARWRDQLFGVAIEPVLTIASRKGLGNRKYPRTRRDLIAMLRDSPDHFGGRIAAYDPYRSGLGYFLLSQDIKQSEGFWRLAEVMGRLNTRLFCCAGDMLRELRSGRTIIAYNVIGSYADKLTLRDPDLIKLHLDDYSFTVMRSAFVPKNAADQEAGTDLLSYLLAPSAQRHFAQASGVALIPGTGREPSSHMRLIRLDMGLLVYNDQLRKSNLLGEWNAAMVQP